MSKFIVVASIIKLFASNTVIELRQSLALKITTPEECTIHYLEINQSNNEFLDNFLSKNQASQRWTISSSGRTEVEPRSPGLWGGVGERCTVNIATTPFCYDEKISNFFYPHSRITTSIFITIVPSVVDCMASSYGYIKKFSAPYFLVRLDPGCLYFEKIFLLCPSLSMDASAFIRIYTNVSFHNLAAEWKKQNSHFHKALLLIGTSDHVYNQTDWTSQECPYQQDYTPSEQRLINCNHDLLFAFLISQWSNMTLVSTTDWDMDTYIYSGKILLGCNYPAYPIKFFLTNYALIEFPTFELVPYFIHCVRSIEHESFDYMFLASLVDPLTLGLILLVYGLLQFFNKMTTFCIQKTNVGSKEHIKTEIYRTLLVFLVCTMYESYLSSDVTVPPPPFLIKSVKELLVDRQYKVCWFPADFNVFKPEGLTDNELVESIKYNDKVQCQRPMFDMLVETNVTVVTLSKDFEGIDYYGLVNSKGETAFCNYLMAKNVRIRSYYRFYLYSRHNLYIKAKIIIEAGILTQYTRYGKYRRQLRNQMGIERNSYKDSGPKKLKMSDWRITPTFAIFGAILLLSLLSAVAEIFLQHAKFICHM